MQMSLQSQNDNIVWTISCVGTGKCNKKFGNLVRGGVKTKVGTYLAIFILIFLDYPEVWGMPVTKLKGCFPLFLILAVSDEPQPSLLGQCWFLVQEAYVCCCREGFFV